MLTVAASTASTHVQDFCRSIVANGDPLAVFCMSVDGAPINSCFPLVEQMVAQEGGAFVLGWAIWEIPGVMIEAELHAVWRQPSGQLLDISPREVPFREITFLPDSSDRRYDRQVDNIRKPLTADPSAQRIIDLLGRRFALLNEGDLADQIGEIELGPEAYREYEAIEMELGQLFMGLARRGIGHR
jgi:hypothetical protein